MKKSMQTLVMAIGLAIFFILLFFATRYESAENKAQFIVHDLEFVDSILKKIDKDCEISGFTNEKNPLTFFTVVAFTGSEVGTLNLVNPDRWKGPYCKDNPSMQGIEYQVVKTKNGLFILPGDGVKLPNGKIIGKEIIFNKESNIEKMIQSGDLCYKEYCFGRKFNMSEQIVSDLDAIAAARLIPN